MKPLAKMAASAQIALISPQLVWEPVKEKSSPAVTTNSNTSKKSYSDVSFGVRGLAGTGKTYLAVACAVDMLERNEIERILFVRPAVEAGEKLGFLPGDLTQKIDPYLRPLYDALYEMLGFEKVAKLIEKQVIEVAPSPTCAVVP